MENVKTSSDEEFYSAREDEEEEEEEDIFYPVQDNNCVISINNNGSYLTSKKDFNNQYNLHRLTFYSDIKNLNKALAKSTVKEITELDPQGNSILHLAVLRNDYEALKTILLYGESIPTDIKSSRGWTPIDEAVCLKNKKFLIVLHNQHLEEMKTEVKLAKKRLLKTLNEMQDYSMEVNWHFGSSMFGYLLKKLAPHDTYKIWKKGMMLRVDGTLMGIEKVSNSFLPEWKRGNFSLLFWGHKEPAQVYLYLHEKNEYLDLTEEKLNRKKTMKYEINPDVLMTDGAGRTKLRPVDFRFKPLKNWLGTDVTEKIEGWHTKVYEASGKLSAVTSIKSQFNIPKFATYEEYLNLNTSEDKIVEITVNLDNISKKDKDKDKKEKNEVEQDNNNNKKGKGKGKKFSGRCWMAEDFPMSLSQLLPIMDVIGHANKHLEKVSKFMKKYGEMNMFPVRVQVPLLLTVYVVLSFKKFNFVSPDELKMDFFEIPKSAKKISLDDVFPNHDDTPVVVNDKCKKGKRNYKNYEGKEDAEYYDLKEPEDIEF